MCTIEARQFSEAYGDIQALGAELFGVSPDDHPTQCSFAAEMKAPFPMIGDASHEVAERFGVPFPFVKRYRRVSFGHLQVEVTVDDPKAYTKPWSVRLSWDLQPDTDLIESICEENNKDVPHMVGK